MKLPLTDKFLMDLYELFQKTDETLSLISFPYLLKRRVFAPELYALGQKYKRERGKKEFNRLLHYLKRKGYIKIENLQEKQAILLTKKGGEKVLRAETRAENFKKRTDGKWTMIIFDIPEKKRHLRDILRNYLRLLKFKMLQQSVWVSPFDVIKKTENILQAFSLDPYVKVFLIEEIEQ